MDITRAVKGGGGRSVRIDRDKNPRREQNKKSALGSLLKILNDIEPDAYFRCTQLQHAHMSSLASGAVEVLPGEERKK